MNLSEPFIRRPVMTTLVMVTVMLLGLMSYVNLPISNLPDVNYPSIQVTAALPGANPETMANTVATPMEKEFMTIQGVTSVTSTSTLGNTTLVLQFDVNKDIDAAAQDVQAAITRSKTKLPPNLPNDPTYRKVNPSDSPIIYIAVTSDTISLADLYNYASILIGQHISMIDGVAQVTTYGTPFAIRVQVDPGELAYRNISLREVANAAISANPILATGQLDGNVRSSPILASGQLTKGEQYQSVVISYQNNSPVRVKDVGKAIDSLQNDRQKLRYHSAGKDTTGVVIAVQRQPRANTVQVADRIHAFLPTLTDQLPASVDLEVVFDRSDSIRESIAEVKVTLFVAFILVVCVIFLYLGQVADTIIPTLAMPMSLLATFIAMWYFNFSLDNLSLLGLTLAVGFIIDDAIVVQENIVRRVEKGESPWEASILGSQQISSTVVSMTLSLMAIFIPMLFMGGLIGKIFQEFSITLAVVTLASGIIALTLTPMLCSRFVRARDEDHRGPFARFAHNMHLRMLNAYQPVLIWMLARPKIPLAVGILSVLLSAFMFWVMPTDFIPDEDIGFIIGYAEAEQGTSSDRMKGYQQRIMEVLEKNKDIKTVVSIVAQQQFRQGINFIRLQPKDQRKSSTQIIQELYPQLGMIPGVNVYLKNVPLIDLAVGGTAKGAYQYTMQGQELDELYDAAEILIEKMRNDKSFQGITSDLERRQPQLQMEILRDRAYALGVTPEDIETALFYAYSGNRVDKIQTSIDQFDVIVELERKYQKEASTLSTVWVRSSNTNKLVPLSAVADWKEAVGIGAISHISQFPAVTISFNVTPGIPLGNALQRLKELATDTLPPEVQGSVKGAAETFETAIQSTGILFVFAVIAIYITLGILYESFIHPLTVLTTLPPAVLGGLLTLALFGRPLSLYAYLGLILLIGIVKKNGIMMVDYAIDFQREQGKSPYNAILDACLERFRPIMMTTVAAIAGAIPIIMGSGAGSESRRPLGMVIIGGLLFSQLITLFLTPVMYLYLDRFTKEGTKADKV
ncbi:MAG: efflux RND transporter permease subunit [Chlamydiales bacterium]|nr:efflux RND transporter permease subunit [Chlamydiales bacterium]